MKRSAQKPSLADLLKQDTRPRSQKTERDASDDLAKMFDDGTPLRSASDPPQPAPSPTIPDGDRKTVVVGEQKTVGVGVGQTVDFKEQPDAPKTKIKTSTLDDDEAMPLLRARIGKAPRTEAVLLSLLDTLEARTDVASPDALLAHVLTKKLAPRSKSAPQRPTGGEVAPAPAIIYSAEELADLNRLVDEAKAELAGEGK